MLWLVVCYEWDYRLKDNRRLYSVFFSLSTHSIKRLSSNNTPTHDGFTMYWFHSVRYMRGGHVADWHPPRCIFFIHYTFIFYVSFCHLDIVILLCMLFCTHIIYFISWTRDPPPQLLFPRLSFFLQFTACKAPRVKFVTCEIGLYT